MADDIDAALARELADGEALFWSGRPDPARMRKLFGVWLFAVPWTVFALVWTGLALSVWRGGPPHGAEQWGFGVAMPLFGVPFVLVGFYMMRIPLAAMAKARRSIYALTDRRLLRLTLARHYEVESLPLAGLGPVRCKIGRDGWGELVVQTGIGRDSDGDRTVERFTVPAVPEAETLYRLLRPAAPTAI